MISISQIQRLSALHGYTEYSACLKLAELAEQVEYPNCIVEVGSFTGKSACWIASAAHPHVPIYCIDLWDSGRKQDSAVHRKDVYAASDTFKLFLTQIEQAGVKDRITYYKAHSHDIAKQWNANNPIGLLWLDGDHSYENVMAEIALYGPYVAVGGYMALHDVGNPKLGTGRIVREYLTTSAEWSEPEMVLWAKHPARRGIAWVKKVQ